MHSELTIGEFEKLHPLLENCLPDPMLHTVLEGNQPGRVFVDQREEPTCAYVWPMMEYSYIIGQPAQPAFYQSLRQVIETQVLPMMAQSGMGFISIIPFDNRHRVIFQELFADRWPLSLGVNTFTFDEAHYRNACSSLSALPDGFTLVEMDSGTLEDPANEQTLEDIRYCWGNLERFLELGKGTCLLEDGEIVSCCYAIAYGAQAYHVNVWTALNQRRKGFARLVCAAFIESCLAQGRSLYWLCDRDNLASRMLAESLGYTYQGDLFPVDVPCSPVEFYAHLGEHFFNTLLRYDRAAELYEQAFALGSTDKDALYQAAVAWARAGNPQKALGRLQDAVGEGWHDQEALLAEGSFALLQSKPDWEALLRKMSGSG